MKHQFIKIEAINLKENKEGDMVGCRWKRRRKLCNYVIKKTKEIFTYILLSFLHVCVEGEALNYHVTCMSMSSRLYTGTQTHD